MIAHSLEGRNEVNVVDIGQARSTASFTQATSSNDRTSVNSLMLNPSSNDDPVKNSEVTPGIELGHVTARSPARFDHPDRFKSLQTLPHR